MAILIIHIDMAPLIKLPIDQDCYTVTKFGFIKIKNFKKRVIEIGCSVEVVLFEEIRFPFKIYEGDFG